MTYFFEISSRKIIEITNTCFDYLIPQAYFGLVIGLLISLILLFVFNLFLKGTPKKVFKILFYCQVILFCTLIFFSYYMFHQSKKIVVKETGVMFNSMIRIIYPAYQYYMIRDSARAMEEGQKIESFAGQFALPENNEIYKEKWKVKIANIISKDMILYGVLTMNERIDHRLSKMKNLTAEERKKKRIEYNISLFNLQDWQYIKVEIAKKMQHYFDSYLVKIHFLTAFLLLILGLQFLVLRRSKYSVQI